MRSLRSSVVLALAASVVAAAPLLGQAQAASPFHRGQWGVDFNVGNGFVGAGLIHFRAPDRAFVVDLNGSVTTSTGPAQPTGNATTVGLSLGARRYHRFAAQLIGFRTFGLEGSYGHVFLSGSPSSTTWTGGLFGELGGGWMVTPHLALGASWRLSADYEHLKTGAATGHSWTITLGHPRLTGQIYF